MDRPINILIAGGKTGGHLFPGIAVAQALTRLDTRVRILFVGTGTSFETQTLQRYGFAHRRISSSGIKGKRVAHKLAGLARIPLSMAQALKIIRAFKPDLTLGVGGYASGPVLAAARLSGKLTAIQEQNAFPGLTNRILSYSVHRIFLSFKETRWLSGRPGAIHTGNPIRREAVLLKRAEKAPPSDDHRFTLLVTGGSQGASSINRAFLDGVQRMPTPREYRIFHQTGPRDEADVIARYRQLKIDATARAFFTDMPELQQLADLIICRSGAGTLSEICALGRPAILIPYPHAADDHQRHNAMALEKAGAARMIPDNELSGARLLAAIDACRQQPETLEKMARAAHSLGMPLAGETVAAELLNLISKGR